MKIKVENEPDLVRDTKSNAVLNTDNRALQAYKKQKKLLNSVGDTSERMDNMEQRLINIENILLELVRNNK
jgi:hypothetical protein